MAHLNLKNHFEQLAVPFKIYADFECLLKGVKNSDENNTSYTENIRIISLVVLLIKLFALIINLTKGLFFIREKMQFMETLKQILKSTITVKNNKKSF